MLLFLLIGMDSPPTTRENGNQVLVVGSPPGRQSLNHIPIGMEESGLDTNTCASKSKKPRGKGERVHFGSDGQRLTPPPAKTVVGDVITQAFECAQRSEEEKGAKDLPATPTPLAPPPSQAQNDNS